MIPVQNIMKHHQHLTLTFIVIISFLFSGISSVAAKKMIETRENSDATSVMTTATPVPSGNSDQDDICAFSDNDCTNPEGLHGNFSTLSEEALSNAEIITILFWMEDCASCAEVINTVLPDIAIKYQNQVVFFPIELKEIDSVDRFYQMAERNGVPKNNIGVPLVIIGDQVLTGNQIQTDLEEWINMNLKNDHYAILAIPEFADQLPQIIQDKQMERIEQPINNQNTTQKENSTALQLLSNFGIPLAGIVLIVIIIFSKRSKTNR